MLLRPGSFSLSLWWIEFLNHYNHWNMVIKQYTEKIISNDVLLKLESFILNYCSYGILRFFFYVVLNHGLFLRKIILVYLCYISHVRILPIIQTFVYRFYLCFLIRWVVQIISRYVCWLFIIHEYFQHWNILVFMWRTEWVPTSNKSIQKTLNISSNHVSIRVKY